MTVNVNPHQKTIVTEEGNCWRTVYSQVKEEYRDNDYVRKFDFPYDYDSDGVAWLKGDWTIMRIPCDPEVP